MPQLEIGKSIYSTQFCSLCRALGSPIALFVDSHILSLHGEPLFRFLKSSLRVSLFEVPSGEINKTRDTKEALEDQILSNASFGRDSLFIALGGGVTSDLVGYLASTYLRGVALLIAPTTLLGMVDAAIGGKNGVNTPEGKNLIGTFYSPEAIWMDPSFLKTLPLKEWRAGLAEIFKYALIQEPSLLDDLSLDSLVLLQKACAIKEAIVQRDEREGSLRRILNFGHTVAHAIEKASDYQISHGEAVSIGCIAESYLSFFLGFLPKEELEKILQSFHKIGFELRKVLFVSPASLFQALFRDKKTSFKGVRFVLIQAFGQVCSFDEQYCLVVEEPSIHAMLSWLYQYAQKSTNRMIQTDKSLLPL